MRKIEVYFLMFTLLAGYSCKPKIEKIAYKDFFNNQRDLNLIDSLTNAPITVRISKDSLFEIDGVGCKLLFIKVGADTVFTHYITFHKNTVWIKDHVTKKESALFNFSKDSISWNRKDPALATLKGFKLVPNDTIWIFTKESYNGQDYDLSVSKTRGIVDVKALPEHPTL